MRARCLFPLILSLFIFGNVHAQSALQTRLSLNNSDSLQNQQPFHFAAAPVLPRDYATCNYGFFCRQELKLEKKTGIPIRLRLGSNAECDRLEEKRSNAVSTP